MNEWQTRVPGQGVMEYAGGIVLATLVVGGVILLGPEGTDELYETIVQSTFNFFLNSLPQ